MGNGQQARAADERRPTRKPRGAGMHGASMQRQADTQATAPADGWARKSALNFKRCGHGGGRLREHCPRTHSLVIDHALDTSVQCNRVVHESKHLSHRGRRVLEFARERALHLPAQQGRRAACKTCQCRGVHGCISTPDNGFLRIDTERSTGAEHLPPGICQMADVPPFLPAQSSSRLSPTR